MRVHEVPKSGGIGALEYKASPAIGRGDRLSFLMHARETRNN